MDTQQTPVETNVPIAMPIEQAVHSQTDTVLPTPKSKKWIYALILGIALLAVAIIIGLFLALKGTLETPVNTTQNETVTPVSTPVSITPTPVESTSKLNFDIDTTVWGGTNVVSVEVSAPEGSTSVVNNKSHSLGYQVVNGTNSMEFYIPYESFPQQYNSFEQVGSSSQFGTISRVEVTGVEGYYIYINNTSKYNDCSISHYNEPCGEIFMGSASSDHIFIKCPISSKSFCDKIALTVKVVTTVQEPATKDVTMEVDLSEWTTTGAIKTITVMNVPSDATYTKETQNSGRFIGYRLKNADFSMFFYYPYESNSAKLNNITEVGTNAEFGAFSRAMVEGITDQYFYMNSKGISRTSTDPGYDACMAIVGSVPCGGYFLSNSTNESVFVTCSADSDMSICDKIIESVNVKTK